MDVQAYNREAWDRQVEGGNQWTIPVGPEDTIQTLSSEADQVVCLYTPDLFWAVGAYYAVFDQTPDEEVIRLLQEPGLLTPGQQDTNAPQE